MKAEELANCLLRVGFREVNYKRYMGGVIAIHWGVK